MKNAFYFFIKNLLYCYNFIYFRKINIYGRKNIPKEGGILYSPNHQGAFLDPLLIGTLTPKKITSLTRSDVFGGPLQWFLDALNMLPVYRIRNGYSNLKKNDAIFDQCYRILGNAGNLLMFSEGGHHNEYFLQNLSKGSSRLAYQAQLSNPDEAIYLMPVGINYGHHQQPRCTLHLVFGKPILVKEAIDPQKSEAENINILRENLQTKMKDCLWLPENDDHYQSKKSLIHKKSTQLGFHALKAELKKEVPDLSSKKKASKTVLLFVALLSVFNFVPLWFSKKVISRFKDIVFYSSLKYVLGLLIFPIWWGIIGLVLYIFIGFHFAIAFLGIAVFSIFLRNKLLLD